MNAAVRASCNGLRLAISGACCRPSALSALAVSADRSEHVLSRSASIQLPTFSPSTRGTDEADENQQNQCADSGVDDRCDYAHPEMDAELRKQPTADQGADNTNNDIADDSKPAALQDLTGQPPGDEANR